MKSRLQHNDSAELKTLDLLRNKQLQQQSDYNFSSNQHQYNHYLLRDITPIKEKVRKNKHNRLEREKVLEDYSNFAPWEQGGGLSKMIKSKSPKKTKDKSPNKN